MNNGTHENGASYPVVRQSDELDIRRIIEVPFRHRWVILLTLAVAIVAAVLYLVKATPIYRGVSKVYVEQAAPRISEYDVMMPQSKSYLFTQAEMIRSYPIVSDITQSPRIRRLQTFEGMDGIEGYIKSHLTAEVGRKDDIITVSFECPYPVDAAEVVNALVQSYIKYHSSQKRSTVSEVLSILSREKVTRDNELSAKFEEMLDFTRENGIISVSDRGNPVVFDRLGKLSSALTDAQLNALNTKADYEAVKSMLDEPARVKQFAAASPSAGVRVFVNDIETQLQSELRAAEIELKNVLYHCTEDHPSVQAVHAKINRIKQELNEQASQFADSYVEVMRLRWEAAMQREGELQASFDTQLAEARDMGVKATQYAVLQSELKRLERLCEILDNRIKDLNVTEDAGSLHISVLEVASPAQSPVKPQRARVLALALLAGMMLGGGLAYVREWVDVTLRTSDEISAVLALPVLGVVPSMPGEQPVTASRRGLLGHVRHLLGGTVQTDASHAIQTAAAKGAVSQSLSSAARRNWPRSADKDVVNRGQKAHLKPKSVVAEAYRTIRTGVFFGIPKEEAKTILVTSPAPGDGKSTLVSNLAITMAQAGQKTIIVDADFRKPMQHNIFEIDSGKKGLADVLTQEISLKEAIEHGPVPGLDILHCGMELPNPSEVLNSVLFGGMLQELAQTYDRVIIDSPPVGLVADSQILAATCDIVLLVLRAEKSTRRHSLYAKDSLMGVGGNILGVVVNDVPRKHGRYGYYSSYGSYGGYGYYGRHGYYGRAGNREDDEA